ncbi:PAS domain-containing protein, partial [Arthrospira platensis SPKY2]
MDRQYRSYEMELRALEGRLADAEGHAAGSGLAGEGDEGLRCLLDNVKDGIISVDARGRIRSLNATSERMFGRRAADLLGQGIDALLVIPPDLTATDYLQHVSRIRESTQLDLSPTGGSGRRADGLEFP